MLRSSIVPTILVLTLVVIAGPAKGQQTQSGSDSPTLADRMENFGRVLLGGRSSSNRAAATERSDVSEQSMRRPVPAATTTYERNPYAEPVARPVARASTRQAVVAAADSESYASERPASVPVRRSSLNDDSASSDRSNSGSDSTSGQDSVPLYQRMNSFRDSVFSEQDRKPSSSTPAPAPVTTPTPAARLDVPEVASRSSTLGNSRSSAMSEPLAESVLAPTRAVPAPRTSGNSLRSTEKSDSQTSSGPAARPISSPIVPQAVSTKVSTSVPKKGDTPSRGVLLSRSSPNLSVETIGPQKIAVGKESVYEVNLNNSGDVAAEELVVFVSLPAWAEVLGAEVSVGATQVVPVKQGLRQFQWKLGRMEAKSRERLALRIKPLESRPFDLGIRWDYKQVPTQAMIEVQEPKLALHMDGPRDVLFGKRELYRLKVSNIGTGDAENVVIRLQPLGGTEQTAATHNFGTVSAGEERSIEVELTARQAGTLTMKVDVQCDGGVRAEMNEPVVVRRADLKLEVAAPKFQYVDATAHYRVRVSNPGTAAAHDVKITAPLPMGAKLISASEDGRLDSEKKRLFWRLDVLNPNTERILDAKCTLGEPGMCRLEVQATSGEDLTALAEATTQVDAIADLVMDVVDPAGPVAVGEDAFYELRIRNRGTKSASEIDVAVYFSQGIEPVSVEGGQHRISLGQVAFQTVPVLPAGKEIRLKVVARAQTAGSHVCRSELHCRPLGTRLVSEETTHFYLADGTPDTQEETRTAQRRGPIPAPNTGSASGESRQSHSSSSSDSGDRLRPTPAEIRR